MMREDKGKTKSFFRRPKLAQLMHSNPISDDEHDDYCATASRASTSSSGYCSDRSPMSASSSPMPYNLSPWIPASPFTKSPWTGGAHVMPMTEDGYAARELIGSLVREEGHVYSLAAAGDLLYTGSDSKNIRVWKNQKEFGGFKSNSGLVKAIVVSGKKIFTGHQDGKIRVWKASKKNARVHKRAGTLPTFKDFIKCSMNPSNYVEVRRHRNTPWIKHFDAVSCLSLNEEMGLLYSGSWDKTLKVWRISDSKCLESIKAHDDAINSVAADFGGLVFTGSADGTVKVWKREMQGRRVKHFFLQTLLNQDSAVTAVAVSDGVAAAGAAVVYCGSSDGLVNFWEKEKRLSHGGVLRGHNLAILCLAAEGSLVFSGSADKTICVWRREPSGAHACLSVLYGHGGPVKCLAAVEETSNAAEDDRQWIVYSGSLDRSVKVWKVAERAAAPTQPSPLRSPAFLPRRQKSGGRFVCK